MRYGSNSIFNWRSSRACGLLLCLAGIGWAQRLSFDSPEGWALKHFASSTLLSGLQPPQSGEEHRIGSVTVGFEIGWMPALSDEQARVGFSGNKLEDLNKTPIFARPVVRVGLPWKFTGLLAVTPPVRVWDVTPRLWAFGLERPIVQRDQWTLGWRGYGQFGSAQSSFTCPQRALAFPPGSPNNPASCVAFSADEATLRYGGTEGTFSHKIPGIPKLTAQASAGVNFISGRFQVHAQRLRGPDRTRLWTNGETFSATAGASYAVTKRASFTVVAFYSPMWVQRDPTLPRENDGFFNVRAAVNYRIR